MAENFVKQIDGSYDAEANVYNSVFEQYERVVIQSLITSFVGKVFVDGLEIRLTFPSQILTQV